MDRQGMTWNEWSTAVLPSVICDDLQRVDEHERMLWASVPYTTLEWGEVSRLFEEERQAIRDYILCKPETPFHMLAIECERAKRRIACERLAITRVARKRLGLRRIDTSRNTA